MTDEAILEALVVAEGPGDPAKDYLAKDDRGGRTNWGISERAHPAEWANGKVPSRERAKEIYRAKYLRPFDGVDLTVKHQLVDISLPSGVSRARALLALAQQNVRPPRTLATQLTVERLNFYATIVRDDPTQATNIRGWVRRACTFLALVALLLVLSSACAAHHPPLWVPPPQWAHCTVVQRQGASVFLACPPPSYTDGPQLGWKIVEIDAKTGKVIRVTPELKGVTK